MSVKEASSLLGVDATALHRVLSGNRCQRTCKGSYRVVRGRRQVSKFFVKYYREILKWSSGGCQWSSMEVIVG